MSDEYALYILLIDDEEIIHKSVTPYLEGLGHRVDNAADGTRALPLIEANDYDLALIDIRMPGMDGLTLLSRINEIRPEISSVIITGHGSMEQVIQALRLGAADFLNKPIRLLELDAVLEKSMRIRQLRQTQRRLIDTIGGLQTAEELARRKGGLVGVSEAMSQVRKQIQLAVDAKCETILITGETGTGKEVVAREIHFSEQGHKSPFIAVSCPALPESIIESELFGHIKGSFTGAIMDKAGYFELADGGTLFLDEIADLSHSAQAKILRVLETRKLRRIGGAKEIDVDIRVIAATNVPLEDLVETRDFRKDLFYRLNVFTIPLLPLRDRRQDILPLAEHFLANYSIGRRLTIDGFTQEAIKTLDGYDFPGNARELRNVVERAAILCRSGKIEARQLNLPEKRMEPSSHECQDIDEKERIQILAALEEVKWNRRLAAKLLHIPYSTLRYKMERLGIS